MVQYRQKNYIQRHIDYNGKRPYSRKIPRSAFQAQFGKCNHIEDV